MAIIHRIGTPENDSEAKAIKRLGKDLPDDYRPFGLENSGFSEKG